MVVSAILLTLIRFNSIKVRLKRALRSKGLQRDSFQFHKGPIKARRLLYLLLISACFNSIKVRLKLCSWHWFEYKGVVSIP